jgi:hypothetical protein
MNPSDHPQPEFVNGGRLLTYGHDVATWADKVYQLGAITGSLPG